MGVMGVVGLVGLVGRCSRKDFVEYAAAGIRAGAGANHAIRVRSWPWGLCQVKVICIQHLTGGLKAGGVACAGKLSSAPAEVKQHDKKAD